VGLGWVRCGGDRAYLGDPEILAAAGCAFQEYST
jgi:hypothetical protein